MPNSSYHLDISQFNGRENDGLVVQVPKGFPLITTVTNWTVHHFEHQKSVHLKFNLENKINWRVEVHLAPYYHSKEFISHGQMTILKRLITQNNKYVNNVRQRLLVYAGLPKDYAAFQKSSWWVLEAFYTNPSQKTSVPIGCHQ